MILVSNMFILPCMSCPQKTMKGFVLNKLYCSSQSPGVFSKKGHNSLTHPGLSDLCILPLLLHVFRYIINIFIFQSTWIYYGHGGLSLGRRGLLGSEVAAASRAVRTNLHPLPPS